MASAALPPPPPWPPQPSPPPPWPPPSSASMATPACPAACPPVWSSVRPPASPCSVTPSLSPPCASQQQLHPPRAARRCVGRRRPRPLAVRHRQLWTLTWTQAPLLALIVTRLLLGLQAGRRGWLLRPDQRHSPVAARRPQPHPLRHRPRHVRRLLARPRLRRRRQRPRQLGPQERATRLLGVHVHVRVHRRQRRRQWCVLDRPAPARRRHLWSPRLTHAHEAPHIALAFF